MLPVGTLNFNSILFYISSFIALFIGVLNLVLFFENKNENYPKIKSYKKISVIIPAYNEERNIERSIVRTLQCKYPSELLEVIVVDDGSTDNTYKVAKAMNVKNLRVLTKKNGGKASAVNFGIKHATGYYVMVLDADTFPHSDVFEKTLGYFDDKNVMVVGIAHKVYKPLNLLQKMQEIEYSINNMLRKVSTYIDSLTIAAAGSIFRKEFFDKHGGFDENNLTEDFEMTMRIQSKHYRVANSFDTFLETVSPDTYKKLKRQRIRWISGGLYNLPKFKFMFSPKYGDLGLFTLPVLVLGLSLFPIVSLYYLLVYIKNIVYNYYLFYLIGFDLKYQIVNFFTTAPYFDYSFKTFLIITLLIIFFTTYVVSIRKNNDKVNILHLFFFLFFYTLVLLYFFLYCIALYVLKKKPNW